MKNLSTVVLMILFFYSPYFSQTCIPDEIVFNTQSEIDSFSINYPDCTEVLGDLRIEASVEINDLTGLSQIESIGGILWISGTPNLETLSGLENLSIVEEEFYIIDVESLNDISALNNLQFAESFYIFNTAVENLIGLENIEIERTLRIDGNDSLISLTGLESITSIPNNLEINNNNSLNNILGLANLTFIGKHFFLNSNNSLESLAGLENLNYVGSLTTIQWNNALSDISALMNLDSIGSGFRIESSNLTTLEGLDNLRIIEGRLTINENSNLVDVSSLSNLLTVEQIQIKKNDLLTNLNGLNNIDFSNVELFYLTENPMLSLCGEINICNYISSGGISNIYGNSTGCNSIYEIDSLCDSNNYPRVISEVYFDLNQNKIMDIDEVYFPDASLYVNPIGMNIYTGQDEGTHIYLDEGSYEIGLNQDLFPKWVLTTDSSSYHVVIDTTYITDTISFGLYPISQNSNNIAFITGPPARCGEFKTFEAHTKNLGTTITSGTLWLEVDEIIVATNFIDVPDTIVAPNLYGWYFENLYPGYSFDAAISLQVPAPPDVAIGDSLRFNSYVEYEDVNGVTTSDNFYYPTEIRCSFDPNDKLVNPSRNNNLTLFEEDLIYTIRFQNTGNDEAYDIIVRDTLDENLDPTTFRVLSTSHPSSLITSMEADQFLTFNFENIYLPDSTTNFDASQGYVSYLIKANGGLAKETLIKNTASIYFDFNPPIVTNTTESVMVSELPTSIHDLGGVGGMKIEIFPNPVSDNIFIKKEKSEMLEYQITDVNGRILMNGELVDEIHNITFTKMNLGVYFVKVINPKTREYIVMKIVK